MVGPHVSVSELYYDYSVDTLFVHAIDLGLANADTQPKKDDLVQLIYAHYTWPCEDEVPPSQPDEDVQPPRKKQKTNKKVNTQQEQISGKTLNELAQQEGAIVINNPKRCKFSFI